MLFVQARDDNKREGGQNFVDEKRGHRWEISFSRQNLRYIKMHFFSDKITGLANQREPISIN